MSGFFSNFECAARLDFGEMSFAIFSVSLISLCFAFILPKMADSHADSTLTGVLLSSLFLCYWLYGPSTFYFLYKYRKQKNNILLKKRPYKIVILLNIISLLHQYISYPLMVIAASGRPERYDYPGAFTMDKISSLVYSFLIPSFWFVLLWRFWIYCSRVRVTRNMAPLFFFDASTRIHPLKR